MAERPSLALVVGARPNFVKAAPVVRALSQQGLFTPWLIHTGQHYDPALSEEIFRDLGLPEPDENLGVGSGSHAAQTARTMERLEPLLAARRPAGVLVFGDVNATLAAALTAVKLRQPVAHVEAGLRSFDPEMPEEINRRVTDAVSDLLFVSEPSGVSHLRREGIAEKRIHLVGNTMVDSLLAHLPRARERGESLRGQLGVEERGYAVLTLHRPANVDDAGQLDRLLAAIRRGAGDLPVVFPAHPRTRERLAASGGETAHGLRLVEPLPYLEFVGLLDGARLVLTDSGGIQEETTVLEVPCLTLRRNTERPITVELGTNRLVGLDSAAVEAAISDALARPPSSGVRPPLWDGRAARRIARVLAAELAPEAGGRA